MSTHTNTQNSQNHSPRSAHDNKTPRAQESHTGQGNGVLGHREGKSGNRVESNPDEGRKNKPHA